MIRAEGVSVRSRPCLAFAALLCIVACHKPPHLVPPVSVRYEPADHVFSVQFPRPSPTVRRDEQGPTRATYYSVFDGAATYMVEVFDDPMYRRQNPATILSGMPDPHAAGPDGHFVQQDPISLGGHPGRATRIEGNLPNRGAVTMMHRIFVVDGRIIGVLVATAPGQPLPADAERFLDSFRLP
jgi:hypothetical protein